MQPDRKTLKAECAKDREELIKTFLLRETKAEFLMR
jgi:hypothetical protein